MDHRHDEVRDVLVAACRELKIPVETEMVGLYASSNRRPADFLLPPAKPTGFDRAFDVAITNPRLSSNL